MKEAGIVRIRTSILRRQNTFAQFISTRTILDLCEKEKHTAGRTGTQAVVGADGDRLEGSQRAGGSSSRSGRSGNKGVDGLGVRGRQPNGRDHKRHGGGGVPGHKRLQWSEVERGRVLNH